MKFVKLSGKYYAETAVIYYNPETQYVRTIDNECFKATEEDIKALGFDTAKKELTKGSVRAKKVKE